MRTYLGQVSFCFPVLGLGLGLGFWYLLAHLSIRGQALINPLFLASPSETWLALQHGFTTGELAWDIADSLRRVTYGLTLSIAIGLPVGSLLGLFESVHRLTKGLMDFLRSIPPIIVYPLSQLILGPFDASRVGVVVFGATTVIILHTSEGVRNCAKVRQACSRLLGAKWYHLITSIVMFESLPSIIVGIRTALSLSIIIVVVTEMLVGDQYGLGVRAAGAQSSFATPILYSIILVVGVLGYALNTLLSIVERRVSEWKHAG